MSVEICKNKNLIYEYSIFKLKKIKSFLGKRKQINLIVDTVLFFFDIFKAIVDRVLFHFFNTKFD